LGQQSDNPPWDQTQGFSWYENSDGFTCLERGVGTQAARANIGNPDDALEFAGRGTTFSSRSPNEMRFYGPQSCNHYKWSYSTLPGGDVKSLLPYDDRN
jgi:hypothetical protein